MPTPRLAARCQLAADMMSSRDFSAAMPPQADATIPAAADAATPH